MQIAENKRNDTPSNDDNAHLMHGSSNRFRWASLFNIFMVFVCITLHKVLPITLLYPWKRGFHWLTKYVLKNIVSCLVRSTLSALIYGKIRRLNTLDLSSYLLKMKNIIYISISVSVCVCDDDGCGRITLLTNTNTLISLFMPNFY